MNEIEILTAFATGHASADMEATNKAQLKEMHRNGLVQWHDGIYGWAWQISVTGRDLLKSKGII